MPTPYEKLKTNYAEGQKYVVDGSLLNRIGNNVNPLNTELPTGRGSLLRTGVASSYSPPPAIIGIATITDAADTCVAGTDPDEPYLAPCASRNLYVARFRYYNFTDKEWAEYPEDQTLDAGGFYEPTTTEASQSPTSGVNYGSIPGFSKGDLVNCYWDEQRNMLIPLHSPYQDVVTAEFTSGAIETVPRVPNAPANHVSAFVFIDVRRPDSLGVYPATWNPEGLLCFWLPGPDPETEWEDSRSGFMTFSAPSAINSSGATVRTLVRMRLGRVGTWDVDCKWSRIRFEGRGRLSTSNAINNATVDAYTGGNRRKGWTVNADVKGRFKDSPIFFDKGGSDEGIFEVRYADPLDNWIIGCEFEVCFIPGDNSTSSSASSSSQSNTSSSQTLSSSSSSASSSSGSSSSSNSSSSISSSSPSSISSTSNSSSSLSSSSLSSSLSGTLTVSGTVLPPP